jgi:hypothetical protein
MMIHAPCGPARIFAVRNVWFMAHKLPVSLSVPYRNDFAARQTSGANNLVVCVRLLSDTFCRCFVENPKERTKRIQRRNENKLLLLLNSLSERYHIYFDVFIVV